MSLRNLRLALTLCILGSAMAGCQNDHATQDPLRTWYSMVNSPLELTLSSGRWTYKLDAPLDSQKLRLSDEMWRSSLGQEFDVSRTFGPYRTMETEGQVLLFGPKGKPLWAGMWLFPARVKGEVVALFLFRGLGFGLWDENGEFYEIGIFDIRDKDPVKHWVGFFDAGWIPSPILGTPPWVMDINGDGTDELIYAKCVDPQTGFGANIVSRTSFKWVLRMEDADMSGPHLLEVPLPASTAVQLERDTKIPGGLIVWATLPVKGTATHVRVRVGTIRWDARQKKWTCEQEATKGS